MRVDVVESKYQLLNYYLTWQFINNHIYIVLGNIPIRLAKFERNFIKHNFYFVTQFMSICNFYLETEGVLLNIR